MNVITNNQFTVFSVLLSVATALIVICYDAYKEYSNRPIVLLDGKNECIQVTNVANGDVYDCTDVNFTLRKYRKTTKGS